jgi:hypothetical protein
VVGKNDCYPPHPDSISARLLLIKSGMHVKKVRNLPKEKATRILKEPAIKYDQAWDFLKNAAC